MKFKSVVGDCRRRLKYEQEFQGDLLTSFCSLLITIVVMNRWLVQWAEVAQRAVFHIFKKCMAGKENLLVCFLSQTTCIWSFLTSTFSYVPNQAERSECTALQLCTNLFQLATERGRNWTTRWNSLLFGFLPLLAAVMNTWKLPLAKHLSWDIICQGNLGIQYLLKITVN